MESKELLECMEKAWPDCMEESDTPENAYGQDTDDTVELTGMDFINRFSGLDWQEQDQILSVLQAIRQC